MVLSDEEKIVFRKIIVLALQNNPAKSQISGELKSISVPTVIKKWVRDEHHFKLDGLFLLGVCKFYARNIKSIHRSTVDVRDKLQNKIASIPIAELVVEIPELEEADVQALLKKGDKLIAEASKITISDALPSNDWKEINWDLEEDDLLPMDEETLELIENLIQESRDQTSIASTTADFHQNTHQHNLVDTPIFSRNNSEMNYDVFANDEILHQEEVLHEDEPEEQAPRGFRAPSVAFSDIDNENLVYNDYTPRREVDAEENPHDIGDPFVHFSDDDNESFVSNGFMPLQTSTPNKSSPGNGAYKRRNRSRQTHRGASKRYKKKEQTDSFKRSIVDDSSMDPVVESENEDDSGHHSDEIHFQLAQNEDNRDEDNFVDVGIENAVEVERDDIHPAEDMVQNDFYQDDDVPEYDMVDSGYHNENAVDDDRLTNTSSPVILRHSETVDRDSTVSEVQELDDSGNEKFVKDSEKVILNGIKSQIMGKEFELNEFVDDHGCKLEPRKDATRLFYATLTLLKSNLIKSQQEEPNDKKKYGDIFLTLTPHTN